MTAFLKRIGIIVLGIFGVSMLVSMGSLWALREGDFYKPSFLVNGVSTSDFDYIVLGASTGLTTLNTKVIDSVLHIEGINLSMDDTSISSQYLMLEHFLASGKHADICVLASSASSYDAISIHISDNDYRFLPYVSRGYISDYYASFSGTAAGVSGLSKWLPMAGVGYYNAELFYPSLISLVAPQHRNRFDSKGNYTYPVGSGASKRILSRHPKTIYFKNTYLAKIKALCDSHDIQLVCYVSPLEQQEAILEQTSYDVINHSTLLKDSRYFYDAIHVNTLGRHVASLQFSEDFRSYVISESFDKLRMTE
ncbi:hypothetical protein [Mangrovimonas xylaniphaga]|uniref:hypothetical protein n=1 Tax=Mangrovimonas xylaniphaga TaxID=1645915 RepID=UPI0006B44529|nr:hypothetical protein [Mangrovimonas xylaniphaga]